MTAESVNLLPVKDREGFRQWLAEHAATETECWVRVVKGEPSDTEHLWYLDAVEEALCFGWIDSVNKPLDGVTMQRFTPRRPRSPWTELNKERVRRLEKLGLMTAAGRKVLPPMGVRSFRADPEVVKAIKEARAWESTGTGRRSEQNMRTGRVLALWQRSTTFRLRR